MANSIKLSNQRCKEILVQLSQHAKKIDCPFGHKKGRVPVSAQAKLGLLLKRPVSEPAKHELFPKRPLSAGFSGRSQFR